MSLDNEDIEELQAYCDEIRERRYYDFEWERCDELKNKLEKFRN